MCGATGGGIQYEYRMLQLQHKGESHRCKMHFENILNENVWFLKVTSQ